MTPETIKKIEPRGGSSHHESRPGKTFEEFELDLEVEEILKKVKKGCVLNQGVTQFGEQLAQREEEKRTAQAAREALVEQKWTPCHYPQLTCDWFVEGLDYCCPYWRYQFKGPLTPPPAPPPSPDARRKRALPPQPSRPLPVTY